MHPLADFNHGILQTFLQGFHDAVQVIGTVDVVIVVHLDVNLCRGVLVDGVALGDIPQAAQLLGTHL